VERLCVLPDLTFLHVILFCISKTCVKISLYSVKRGICLRVKLSLDFIKGYGTFNQVVIVGILTFRRQAQEVMGEDAVARDITKAMSSDVRN
jgi:hypothetical protein